MTTIERLATLVMLLPAAVFTGIILLYAIERVHLWERMPIDQFVVDFRRSLFRADPLQPILGIVAIIGSVVFASNVGGTAAVLAWVGMALTVLVIAMSIAFSERINSQFRRREEGDAPPHVEALRVKWRRFHFIRVVPTVGALIAFILATTFV